MDLIPTRHAKGGVRRDALYASTYTSHFTSICSLALHGTSVFRLNALRVIKWFFPPINRRLMENVFLKIWMLTHNDHYVALTTCNCLRKIFCVFRWSLAEVFHMLKNICLILYTCHTDWLTDRYEIIFINAFVYRLKRATSFCSLLKKIAFYHVLLKSDVLKVQAINLINFIQIL